MKKLVSRSRWILGASAVLFAGSAVAIDIDKTVINDGTVFGVGKMTAVQGPNGDVHVVAQGSTVASSFSSSSRHIYYWRIGGGGDVEVNALQVSATLGELSRPDIKVNDANEAIIVWKRYNDGDGTYPIHYAIVGAAGTVTRAEGPVFTPETTRRIPKIVLAADGTAHVVATSYDGMRHRAFTPSSNATVVAEHVEAALNCDTYAHQATAIDSNDNIHTICADGDNDQPLVYWMLDGATGDTLIDQTIINDPTNKAAHFSLFVTSGNVLHVIYGDKRHTLDAGSYCDFCSVGGTAIYTRLKPYEDDQDGDAADPAAIVVGDEKEITNAWYGQTFRGSDGKFHFLSGTAGDDSNHVYTNRNITHVEFSPGGTPSKEGVINAFMDAETQYKQYATGAGKFAFWPEVVLNGVLATGYTYQLTMARVGDLPTGSSGGGGGGSLGLPGLAVLGALAFLRRKAPLALTALLFSGSALAVDIDKTVVNDGATFGVGKMTAVQGPNGDVHVVAQGSTVASSFSSSNRHIYYWRIGGGGDVEVNALQVSTTLGELSRPDIKINDANEAVVVWKGASQNVLYAVVGAGGTVTVPQATAITDASNGIAKVVLADDGTAHVFKTSSSGALHRAFNPATNADVIAQHNIASLYCRTYTHPAIAIDSNDNIHGICSDNDNVGELVYWMVEGSTGDVLIDKTILNADKASHLSLIARGTTLEVVYGDKRNTLDAGTWCDYCSLGGTAFYTRLKPYEDDMDGDAALPADIVVGEEKQVANAWYGQSFLGSDGKIHFLSGTAGSDSSHVYTDRDILHVEFSPGGTPSKEGTINAFMDSVTQYKQNATGAGKFAFWPEVVQNGVLATGYTYQFMMANVSDLPTGSSGGGGGGGSLDLSLLALIAGLGLLRRKAR